MVMSRRKHHKILDLPVEVQDAVNTALGRGVTYEDITHMLLGMGHRIGKSSVGRYGREFSARLTRMREVNEKAKAILEQANGEPLRMEEATAQIGLSMVAEALLKLDDLEGVDPEKLLLAVARLQNSGATRERMRIVWRQEQQAKAKAAAEEVKGIAKKGGLSDELVREIEERVLGIAA